MDPLSALAIATAVVQFVDFGGKLLAQAWKQHKNLSTEGGTGDAELAKIEAELPPLIDWIQEASATLPAPSATTPSQSRLRQVCDECDTRLREVLEYVKDQRAHAPDAQRRRLGPGGLFRGGGRSRRPIDAADIEVASIKQSLGDMKRDVTEAVIFCLW